MAARGAGGIAWLIGAIKAAVTSRGALTGLTATSVIATIAENFHIDAVRQQAVRVSPLSDPESLEFAARAIHWMMGVADGDVIGPKSVLDWNYFHYNPAKGQAWWTRTYQKRRRRRFGYRRRFRGGRGHGTLINNNAG